MISHPFSVVPQTLILNTKPPYTPKHKPLDRRHQEDWVEVSARLVCMPGVAYVRKCVYIHVYIYIHIYIHIHTHTHIYMYTDIRMLHMNINMYTYYTYTCGGWAGPSRAWASKSPKEHLFPLSAFAEFPRFSDLCAASHGCCAKIGSTQQAQGSKYLIIIYSPKD